MSAPVCPTELELTLMIKDLQECNSGEALQFVDKDKLINALRYLDNYLRNRKGYQKKMQIRRRLIMKLASEQGWDKEIDDAVAAQHSNVMEAESLDDVEDRDADD